MAHTTIGMSDSDEVLDIFKEPEGYRQPEKPFTFQEYKLQDGQTLRLRLVGQSPLWGHHLWQAALVISHFLESRADHYLASKSVLELGAAAGLPSLIASISDASLVVATDYPDAELIENLQFNVDACVSSHKDRTTRTIAQGYLWGADSEPLLAHVPKTVAGSTRSGFDTLILADLLFNHSCHDALLRSIKTLLAPHPHSRALVFFTPYRPWLFDKDMAFFNLVREDEELEVVKLGQWHMDKVMFQDDRGDETLRKTVFGFELRWKF